MKGKVPSIIGTYRGTLQRSLTPVGAEILWFAKVGVALVVRFLRRAAIAATR